MTDINKSADAGIVNPEFLHPQTRQAVVTLAAGDAVYIDASGKLAKADADVLEWSSTGSYREPKFDGIAPREIVSGTYGEIYGAGSEWHYADGGLTIGAPVYLSANAGKLADAPADADDAPVAKAISATNIILKKGV